MSFSQEYAPCKTQCPSISIYHLFCISTHEFQALIFIQNIFFVLLQIMGPVQLSSQKLSQAQIFWFKAFCQQCRQISYSCYCYCESHMIVQLKLAVFQSACSSLGKTPKLFRFINIQGCLKQDKASTYELIQNLCLFGYFLILSSNIIKFCEFIKSTYFQVIQSLVNLMPVLIERFRLQVSERFQFLIIVFDLNDWIQLGKLDFEFVFLDFGLPEFIIVVVGLFGKKCLSKFHFYQVKYAGFNLINKNKIYYQMSGMNFISNQCHLPYKFMHSQPYHLSFPLNEHIQLFHIHYTHYTHYRPLYLYSLSPIILTNNLTSIILRTNLTQVVQIAMAQKKDNLEDRDKLKQAKLKLSEIVYETKKKILQGVVAEAHDQLYKFITQQKDKLGGDDSVFLLPGLLTIAEIHIIQGRLKKAQQYLNGAHWSFLKNNDKNQINKKSKQKAQSLTKQEERDYKINLHRTFAKLYEVKSDFKEAANQLKQATYLECMKWGPEHPQVALNYFLMGKIFIDMGNQPIGQSFFAKVAEIWYRYLKNVFQKSHQQQQGFLVQQLGLQQAINYLTFIEKHFQQAYQQDQVGVVFTPVMRTLYSIGFLYKIFGDDTQCEGYLKQVYKKCLKFLPQDDLKTQKIKSLLIGMNADIEIDQQSQMNHNNQNNQNSNRNQNQNYASQGSGEMDENDASQNLMQVGEGQYD